MSCLHDKQEENRGHIITMLHPCVLVVADLDFFFACLELYLTVGIYFPDHIDEWRRNAEFFSISRRSRSCLMEWKALMRLMKRAFISLPCFHLIESADMSM